MSSRILTIPNILTMVRLVMVPVFLGASLSGRHTLAFVLFIGAAVTDIFDGFIARRLNQRSRLGALLDPAADKTIMICGYLFYTLHAGLRAPIPAWVTFAIFIRDFAIIVFAYLLYTRVQVTRFPPSAAGKASTVIQAVTLGVVIAVNSFAPTFGWLAEILYRLAVVATLYAGWGYMRRARLMLDDGSQVLDRAALST
jgi:cardiolipin synthase